MFWRFILLLLLKVGFAATYPVAEPDPIEELSRLANSTKLEELIKRAQEKVWEYSAEYLPPAQKNNTRYLNPTYCLERPIEVPIADKNRTIVGWRVLYPAGYCFNPLEYLNVAPPPFVVFNPSDPKQLKFVQERIYPKFPNALFVLSGISLKTAKKIAKNSFLRRVHWYFLTKNLRKKLKLRAVISIVSVDLTKKMIEIWEVKP